ncbi:hypothetical protein [Chryseobacterium sp. MP_3.2]|uniref:hypothetical protein n=1 Tax=Chryseobacterium sp. MP_3.2 TaxID=3071712 RepID=UPI002DF9828A|nr:hypothetical protein [Chryseobacterium sp. MP_3.2]
MKKQYFLTALITLMLFSSCKDNAVEKLEKERRHAKYKKERVLKMNNDFSYISVIIAFRTNLPIEIVKKVLKEYYISKHDFIFEPNSLLVKNDYNRKNNEHHNLDLIEITSKKYSFQYKDVVAIYSEIESLKIIELTDEISSLSNRIEDLEGVVENK